MTKPKAAAHSQQTPHQVYLGLGSNLGDRAHNLAEAIRLIGERIGTVSRQSTLIETEPWGYESRNRFLNGVILCETLLSPQEVLKATQKIERELGRKKKTTGTLPNGGPVKKTYADRPIDIDLLLYDELTIDEPNLKIPHPLMQERDFVMIPLREIKE